MVAMLFLLIGISTVWLARCIREEIHRIACMITGIILVVWSLLVAAPALQLSVELAVLTIGIMKTEPLEKG